MWVVIDLIHKHSFENYNIGTNIKKKFSEKN